MCRLVLLISFFCFIGTLFSVVPVSAESFDEIQNRKKRLEKVNKEIQQKKKNISRVKKKEQQIITKLNSIEKQLAKENRGYTSVNKQIKSTQKEIRKIRKEIDRLTARAKEKEKYLHVRLEALYKYYRRSGLRILLSSETYNEFIMQEKFLGDIVAKDNELFRNCLATLNERRHHQDNLKNQKEELVKQKRLLSKKRNSIKKSHKDKVSFLKKIKREKSMQLKALKELEEYSKELQAFLDTLPGKVGYAGKGIKFSKLKGKLNFPVKGKIITRFGKKEHPELHTFTFQKGIEIKAENGTPIKAIHDGKVVFADWFKGYGYMIIIDHGDSYYSLSAHASQLLKKVDDLVTGGDTVALVGDTNSIKGNCLYFEIRHHGKPQNPMKWLKRG